MRKLSNIDFNLMQFSRPLCTLKVYALKWAINRCCWYLRQPPQRLSIEFSNRHLTSSECGSHEKKIVIGDNAIVTYEHYSEPGNPFLSNRYEDFYSFLRSWFGPTITKVVQDWFMTNPEFLASLEKAKASGDWRDHLMWSANKSKELYDALYWGLDKYLNTFPLQLVKLLLFGPYKFSYKALHQELIGEWVTQDAAKLRYVFDKDEFIRYDEDQPKQFSYRIRVVRNRYLSLDTIYLANKNADVATLYFFDNCKTLQYRSGSYSVNWQRSDNKS